MSPQRARTGEKPAAVWPILDQREDDVQCPLLYEVTKSCQTSCYILTVVSCLFKEVSGAETCIDVHVITTRPIARTPGKESVAIKTDTAVEAVDVLQSGESSALH